MKNIKMILFDIDNTLVYGEKASIFYGYYSRILEKTLAETLGIELDKGVKIANEHRIKYNGQGEKSFQTHNINMSVWYDALVSLDPRKYLEPMPMTNKIIKSLKERGIIIGAITDGPRAQVDRIFSATNIDIFNFNFIIGWEREKQMPKYGSSAIYEKVCAENNISKDKTIMIGDSLGSDILPALRAGLNAIHISHEKNKNGEKYLTMKNIEPLINLEKI